MAYARKFILAIAFSALVSVLLFRSIRTDDVKITVRADVSALRSELQWQFARLESKLHELEHHHK